MQRKDFAIFRKKLVQLLEVEQGLCKIKFLQKPYKIDYCRISELEEIKNSAVK